jgi:hypothetical protein
LIQVSKIDEPIGDSHSLLYPTSGRREGKLEIVQNQWRGIVVQGISSGYSASILTDGVFWECRIDEEDSKIFSFYPRDTFPSTDPRSERKLPGKAKIIQWHIKSGQQKTNATVLWLLRL